MPAKSGGVESHVENLAINLANAGHDVYVYTRPNYTNKKLKKYQGVNLISLPTIGSKHLDAISHTFLACFDVARRDADIIHFHSIGPSSLIWLAKLLNPGTPVLSTFHTKDYEHQKWGILAKAYLKFGEMMSCVFADKTIAVSHSLANYAKEAYSSDAVYIPNGVEIKKPLVAKEISQWGLKKDNYIVAVSRLVRHKGIHHLIKAYQKLNTTKKLVIVGGGAFTDDYVNELKIMAIDNKNIIFTGAQSGRVLTELFSNAYLFIQPSESEGLSIALLEAMSYKKAVLVSDIDENREAIGDMGFTFKSGSVESLKKKLEFLLAHPKLVHAESEKGYARVKEFYNWKNITRNILKAYKGVMVAKEKTKKQSVSKQSLVRRFVSFLF